MDARLDRLQTITQRLRGGPGVIRKDIIRDAHGRPTAIEERPFDAPALLRAGEKLNRELNGARLEGNEHLVYGAALVDFIEAAERYASPESLPGLRRARLDTRDALHEAGVRKHMTLPTKFRILAIPYGGIIPRKGAPHGADLDGEHFSRRTAIRLTAHSERPVLFHHGRDPLKLMGTAPIGTARNWRRMQDGWVCDVKLNADDPRVELLQLLSDRVELFGSTSTAAGKVVSADGEIRHWPVSELSLSPTPQNLHAIVLD